MKKYRLKKEAVPFFKEKYATAIYSFDTWESLQVDTIALEEVEECFISYGHSDIENKMASLAGWSAEDGQRFHFTLNFPSMKYGEHDKFTNGKSVREMMDAIQTQLDYYYTQLNNDYED